MAASGASGPSSGLLTKGSALFLTNCRDKKPIFGPKDDPCSKTVNEDCCGCGKNQCECANPTCMFSYPGNSYTEWEDTETYQQLFLCDAENTSGYGMTVFSGGVNRWWGYSGGWWGGYGWNWWWGGGYWGGWGWGWGWGWGGGWYWGWGGLAPNEENKSCTPVIRWKEDFYRKWFCGSECYVYMSWAYDSCSTPWGEYEVVEAGEACNNRFRGCCASAPSNPCDCVSNCYGCGPCGGSWYGWGWGGGYWGGGWWGWGGNTFGCHCYENTGEKEEGRWVDCSSGCGSGCPPCWYGYVGGYDIWQAKYGSCYKGSTNSSVARLIMWDCESGTWKNVTEEAYEIVPGTAAGPGQWIGFFKTTTGPDDEGFYTCEMAPEEEWGGRWKMEIADGGIKTSNQYRPGYYTCEQCGSNPDCNPYWGDNPCGYCCGDCQPITYCAWPAECSPRVKEISEYPVTCPEEPSGPDC